MPVSQVDRDVEVRLARTHQVKQALLRKAGLSVGKLEKFWGARGLKTLNFSWKMYVRFIKFLWKFLEPS